MPLKNAEDRYGFLAKLFHWLMFVFLVAAMIAGNIDAAMPKGPEKDEALMIHKAFGVLILLLGLARLAWRSANIKPAPAAGVSDKQNAWASRMHWLLYCLMLAQPISGILMSQAAGYPVSFFGLFDVPTLLDESKSLMGLFHELHEVIWIILALAIVGHGGAALRHHFLLKDGVLKRMLKG